MKNDSNNAVLEAIHAQTIFIKNISEQIKDVKDEVRELRHDTTKRLDRLEKTRITWKVGILSLVWALSFASSALFTMFIVFLKL